MASENREKIIDRPLGRKYRNYDALTSNPFFTFHLSLFTLLPFTFHLSAVWLSAVGGRSVGSRRTNLSANGALTTVRPRTADAPSADKRQGKRRFADAQTADKNEINWDPLRENAFRKAEKRDF
jgi:hypothetical protein